MKAENVEDERDSINTKILLNDRDIKRAKIK